MPREAMRRDTKDTLHTSRLHVNHERRLLHNSGQWPCGHAIGWATVNGMAGDFAAWVARQVTTRYGSNKRLADAIGLTLSGFLRGVAAGTLGTESLLRLAEETGESADVLLRLAGKTEVAERLTRLYGVPVDGSPRVVQEAALLLKAATPDVQRLALEWLQITRGPAPSRTPSDELPPGPPRGTTRARGTRGRSREMDDRAKKT